MNDGFVHLHGHQGRELSAKDQLRRICAEGIRERYGFDVEASVLQPARRQECPRHTLIASRLEHELEVIDRTGHTDHFLVAEDLIRHARDQEIPVGPGMGSVGDSLVAYAAGITEIDPIRHGLVFERFLSEERPDAPDFGIQVCPEKREELVEYLRSRHGRDRVALVGICSTMTDEELDLLGMPGREPDMVIHLSAVVIGKEPFAGRVPIARGPQGELIVKCVKSAELEAFGLMRLDILGLPLLTALTRVGKVFCWPYGLGLDFASIPLDEPATYAMLSGGDTAGGFPVCETGQFVKTCREYGIGRFEDIVALIALVWPGPRRLIPEIIARKNGDKPVRYSHPAWEPILRETHGVMLYHEQVIQAIHAVSGIGLGQANIIRQSLSRGNAKDLAEHRVRFIEGCGGRGIGPDLAQAIWQELEQHAPDTSCKAHATGQALLAYRTAWIKANCRQGPKRWIKMIKTGKRPSPKYDGACEVQDFVTLDTPIKCFSAENGGVWYVPFIVKTAWAQAPADDKCDFLFTYWITVNGEKEVGRVAPMIPQKALLKLLSKAIDRGFFDKNFVEKLGRKIAEHLKAQEN